MRLLDATTSPGMEYILHCCKFGHSRGPVKPCRFPLIRPIAAKRVRRKLDEMIALERKRRTHRSWPITDRRKRTLDRKAFVTKTVRVKWQGGPMIRAAAYSLEQENDSRLYAKRSGTSCMCKPSRGKQYTKLYRVLLL